MRFLHALLLVPLALLAAGCGGGGGAAGLALEGDNAPLEVHAGRLVDVYGLRDGRLALYRRDVLAGLDVPDQRTAKPGPDDAEITFDLLFPLPGRARPRLLIPREIDGEAFASALARLERGVAVVTPHVRGPDTRPGSFSAVARNAALRVTFRKALGIDESFFVVRDDDGRAVGLRNTEAVQLLARTDRGFEPVPVRVVVRGHALILDPVLLGEDAATWQAPSNASGMPQARDRQAPNMRLAIALEGPLRLPGLSAQAPAGRTGENLAGRRSVVWDFRSGHPDDDSAALHDGFLRDGEPPRLLGSIPLYLERVEDLAPGLSRVTLFKNGLAHELDRGDVLRVALGARTVETEILEDPLDDRGRPEAQHVRVLVRAAPELAAADPSRRPDYPGDPKAREVWLVDHAPRVALWCPFEARWRDPASGRELGDDPRLFVRFSPEPLPVVDPRTGRAVPSLPWEHVSPFAHAHLRFTEPIDAASARPLEAVFVATRNVLDEDAIARFAAERGIDPARLSRAKLVTPHLVETNLALEDGGLGLRLWPSLGFYLDEEMRRRDGGRPFEEQAFRYQVHVRAGADGVRDLAGNGLDLGEPGRRHVVTPFALDLRKRGSGEPLFPDNLAVTIARRFADADEDERPSYYLEDEAPRKGAPLTPRRAPMADVFGAAVHLPEGILLARPLGRISRYADDLNQQPPPPQRSPFRWCPEKVGSEPQMAFRTLGVRLDPQTPDPFNPLGSRFQAVWREIDLGLQRTDPYDFDLDVEQLYWGAVPGREIVFDAFDRVSLVLGHAEARPEPCVGEPGGLPTMASSGISGVFDDNFLANPGLDGKVESRSAPHPAVTDRPMFVDASQAIEGPQRMRRYLPFPPFARPYFVWRDQTVREQGGSSLRGYDTATSRAGNYAPYVLSPFLAGRGEAFEVRKGQVQPVRGAWDNRDNYWIRQTGRQDRLTGGLVGAIALPLLLDLQVLPDAPDLPPQRPSRALGLDPWQLGSYRSWRVPTPNFRAYSGGGVRHGKKILVAPGSRAWKIATGGIDRFGRFTRGTDSSQPWLAADFLQRQVVVTAGFVDVLDPHRMPAVSPDPRLGPWTGKRRPPGAIPRLRLAVHRPRPGPGEVVVELRAAGVVDPSPWAAVENGYSRPDPDNFPLDPRKAGDAHIRKFDDRLVNGKPRNAWTYYYHRHVTDYTADPEQVLDPGFLARFAGPNETFTPEDVRYLGWRLILRHDPDRPQARVAVDSLVLAYRFERSR